MFLKKALFAAVLIFACSFNVMAAEKKDMDKDFMFIKKSENAFKDTVTKIENDLKKKSIQIFAKFDHAKNAKDAGLTLDETTVIVFGDPKVGTKLMQENQLIAEELPLKILVWQDKNGDVFAGFVKPGAFSKDFGMDANPIIGKMQGLMEGIVAAGTGK